MSPRWSRINDAIKAKEGRRKKKKNNKKLEEEEQQIQKAGEEEEIKNQSILCRKSYTLRKQTHVRSDVH